MGRSGAGRPDPRFFEARGPIQLGVLADLCGARLVGGGDMPITAVAPLADAQPGQVAFLRDARHMAALAETGASAVFLRAADAMHAPASVARLITNNPQAAYALAAGQLHRVRRIVAGQPAIHPSAELEGEVDVAPGVVIGPGARVGRGTRLGANVVVGPGVCVGRECEIGPGAAIGFALIGDRVRILANAVIGEQGFGVGADAAGALDIPQLGRVIIQDGVTVGACSCIDRGAYGDTVIGENSKIDNLVQVAHNVRIGRNCVLAAHTGISGSVVIGDGAMFGGRAGVVDHRKVGPGAKVGAAAAVMSDVPAGETWSGYPARPLSRTLRESAWVARQARRRPRSPQGGGE